MRAAWRVGNSAQETANRRGIVGAHMGAVSWRRVWEPMGPVGPYIAKDLQNPLSPN